LYDLPQKTAKKTQVNQAKLEAGRFEQNRKIASEQFLTRKGPQPSGPFIFSEMSIVLWW